MLVQRRVVMSWRRVGKSLLTLVAHSLLFSFTLLLALKLDRTVSYSWCFLYFVRFFEFPQWLGVYKVQSLASLYIDAFLHRNLVKVITACSSIDFKGNDFKSLVYEFMVNGSLEEWLHSSQTTVTEESHPKELTLVHRLNIAIDVATALDYLQHPCQIPIIHCDLKPSNVLLDGEMIAHVGDFGLSRFLVEAPNQLSPSQTSSISLKGSIGYAAPGTGRDVSTYGDVYSYGIMLLELFTRKRPTDEMFKDGMNLHRFARLALPDRVLDVVDPILLQGHKQTGLISFKKMDPAGKQKIMESLIAILRVGVACSAELPRQRMDMSIALAELHRIRAALLPADILSHREVIDESEGLSLVIDSL